MEDRLKINIKIGGSKHPLQVPPEDEEVVRKAAALVNGRVAHYAEKYKKMKLPQEYMLAFAAVDIAVRYLKLDNDNNTAIAETEIESMAKDLRQYLNQ